MPDPGSDHHGATAAAAAAAAGFQPHSIPGVSGPELGATDFMQTLQTYIGQPVDMQHHEGQWSPQY